MINNNNDINFYLQIDMFFVYDLILVSLTISWALLLLDSMKFPGLKQCHIFNAAITLTRALFTIKL